VLVDHWKGYLELARDGGLLHFNIEKSLDFEI
jgi:hypothetical protein